MAGRDDPDTDAPSAAPPAPLPRCASCKQVLRWLNGRAYTTTELDLFAHRCECCGLPLCDDDRCRWAHGEYEEACHSCVLALQRAEEARQ